MNELFDVGYRHYGGAPDECGIHCPTKFDGTGNCPECEVAKEVKPNE